MRVFNYQLTDVKDPRQMVLLFEDENSVIATDVHSAKKAMSDPDNKMPYIQYARADWDNWYKEALLEVVDG
jgi:hypothetical protein